MTTSRKALRWPTGRHAVKEMRRARRAGASPDAPVHRVNWPGVSRADFDGDRVWWLVGERMAEIVRCGLGFSAFWAGVAVCPRASGARGATSSADRSGSEVEREYGFCRGTNGLRVLAALEGPGAGAPP